LPFQLNYVFEPANFFSLITPFFGVETNDCAVSEAATILNLHTHYFHNIQAWRARHLFSSFSSVAHRLIAKCQVIYPCSSDLK
jgi:hypothetical protein